MASASPSIDGDVHGNHGYGYKDFWIFKLDVNGDTLWTKCYGGSNEDRAYSIQQTADGGYVVAGSTASTDGDVHGNQDTTNTKFWILKLNAIGDTIWTRCYGGTGLDQANDVLQTTDGKYLVAGWTASTDGDVHGNHGGNVYGDYWILKLDVNGDTIWTRCYGGSNDDFANSIQQTSDGGFIIAGYAYSDDGDVFMSHHPIDLWIVKIDNIITGISTQGLSNDLEIYPNPTQNQIKITNNQLQITNLQIMDITGKQVKIIKTKGQSKTYTIDIEYLPPGLYLLKVIGDKGTEVTKFIKE